jgi:hypothetical protein
VSELPLSGEPAIARELTKWELFLSRIDYYWTQLRRKFPYLVWYDQEIDVGVRFVSYRLFAADFDEAFAQFYSGKIYEAERLLKDVGLHFDTGMGCGGRDWEWDYSLTGPISVRFRRRARYPDKRNQITPPTSP